MLSSDFLIRLYLIKFNFLPKLFISLGQHANYKKTSKENHEIIKLFPDINKCLSLNKLNKHSENAWTRSSEPVAAEPAPVREPEPAAPVVTERPKLQLKPRTLPVAEVGAPVAASSIFGAAKPVNTAAREREIEERMKSEGVKHDEECVVFERRSSGDFWA